MTSTLLLAGHHLEYRWIDGAPDRAARAPAIVFLHEGLGSVSAWRDFPDRVAGDTGLAALLYSRLGYGASDPVAGPRAVSFMHEEALSVLPALLRHFELDNVILFGHSDGASIALIYAGAAAGPVRALVLEAPHVFVEPICVQSISRLAASFESSGLHERLARHHGPNTESMFRSWTGVWLDPEFRGWNIEAYLPGVVDPVLVVQGERDEYGTLSQVDAIMARVRGPVTSLVLPDGGHAPHRDQPERVLAAVTRFIRDTLEGGG